MTNRTLPPTLVSPLEAQMRTRSTDGAVQFVRTTRASHPDALSSHAGRPVVRLGALAGPVAPLELTPGQILERGEIR